MKIIPQDLFIWFAAPVDFDHLWRKLDHKSNLEEFIHWNIEENRKNYYLYKKSVQFRWDENSKSYKKSYLTILEGRYGSRETAQFWIDFNKSRYLEHPEDMYSYCGLPI